MRTIEMYSLIRNSNRVSKIISKIMLETERRPPRRKTPFPNNIRLEIREVNNVQVSDSEW